MCEANPVREDDQESETIIEPVDPEFFFELLEKYAAARERDPDGDPIIQFVLAAKLECRPVPRIQRHDAAIRYLTLATVMIDEPDFLAPYLSSVPQGCISREVAYATAVAPLCLGRLFDAESFSAAVSEGAGA